MRLSCTIMEIWRLKDNGVTTFTFWDDVTSSVTWPFDSRESTSYTSYCRNILGCALRLAVLILWAVIILRTVWWEIRRQSKPWENDWYRSHTWYDAYMSMWRDWVSTGVSVMMTEGGGDTAFEYTRPRVPIAASYTGPGPCYGLPGLVGRQKHDPRSRHPRAPAYHFGSRPAQYADERSIGPGPCYLPPTTVCSWP